MTIVIIFALAVLALCYGASWLCHLAADAITFLIHALTGKIPREGKTPKGELNQAKKARN